VKDKGNWEVLLGTPVSHLLSLSGYRPQKHERVVMGGPMMGFALPTTELPVVKTTNCLLAPTEKELPTNNPAMACIRCGMCADACPADLLPQQLYWFSKAQEFDKAEQHNLFDCIECGACSYVCPSEIPLVQYYRFAKGSVREERAASEKAEQARIRYEARIERQEREKAEKEAKRKARAEAAAKAQSVKKDAPAKAAPAASESSTDLEKLQKQLSAAQAAVTKTKDKLEAARNDEAAADKVPAFEAALAKTQDKIKALAKEIAAAKKAAKANPDGASPGNPDSTDKGDPNSPERLKKKWEMAEGRLETARKRLAEAELEGSENVDALRSGVEKQQVRVNDAKAAYEAAVTGQPDSEETPVKATPEASDKPDIEQLKRKQLAQQDRVEKARERLEMAKAEGLDSVEALERALTKQLDKLAAVDEQISNAGEK